MLKIEDWIETQAFDKSMNLFNFENEKWELGVTKTNKFLTDTVQEVLAERRKDTEHNK